MRSVLLLLVLAISTQSFAAVRKCRERANTAQQARQYMLDHGMVKEGEEVSFPNLGLEMRWEMDALVPTPDGCFIRMGICTISGGKKDCSGAGAIEVLGFKGAKRDEDSRVVSFEEIYQVPQEIIAKVGDQDPKFKDPSFYYVKLSGASSIAAHKSLLAHSPYYGFMGTAVHTGHKAAFDPSPNRDWLIEDATFDLRRGMTAEVLDIQAWYFDGLEGHDAKGYWDTCIYRNEVHGTCQLGPWGQAYIRELIPVH